MDLSQKAPLSPHEVAVLQTLKQDHPKRELSRRHRELFCRWGWPLPMAKN